MITTGTIKLRKPHSQGQAEIISWPGSAMVLAGRRWGKTDAAVKKLIINGCVDPGLYWWVGLTWRSASMKRAWRQLKYYARLVWSAVGSAPKRFIHEVEKEIKLPNAAEIWLRTAEHPESIAGEGIKGVVMDEITLMREVVWTEYVQATLLDFKGWLLGLGVPKGPNWAGNLWKDAVNRGWKQFRFSTYDNPFIDPEAIDNIKETSTELLFRQEYLAEIVDDAGVVFRRVTEAATSEPADKPSTERGCVFGVDWGKHVDFTAIVVMDTASRRQIAMERFNKIDYHFQVARLKALADQYRPAQIIAEANSMGEPVIEQLVRDGLPVRPFVTTNATKAAAVEALALAFERGEIEILSDPVLVNELQAYRPVRLPSGLTRYEAPEGMHDDTVIALMLAWQGVTHTVSHGRIDVAPSVSAEGP